MVNIKIDMTGWKMWEHGVPDSRLIVLERAEDYISPSGICKAQWLCECTCEEHNKIITVGRSLRNGNTKSCGCLHKEQAVLNGKEACKQNEYEIFDDYVKIKFTNVDDYFYVSLSDFDLVSQYAWHRCHSKNYYYVATNQSTQENGEDKYKTLRLTALIGCKWYDHIDGDPRNCRRENLRPATTQENSRNLRIRSNNTSGVTGVSWHDKTNKWTAYIGVDQKHIYLGEFSDKHDAIRTRLQAEAKYFGEFSRNIRLFKEYNIQMPNKEVAQ